MVNLIHREAALGRPGGEPVLTRLIQVLLMKTIRSIPTCRATPSLLSGLIDHPLAPVISQLHAEPATEWTLERMAKIAESIR